MADRMSSVQASPAAAARASDELICHCRQVTYESVRRAVREDRAHTLAGVQQETTACTRCFGCRFEVEGVLREELGERYVPTAIVTREQDGERRATLRSRLRTRVRRTPAAPPPQKMYMPILHGFGGLDVTTRLVLFNLHDEQTETGRPVTLRADLTRLDGRRQDVWSTTIQPRATTMLDVGDMVHEGSLPEGVGIVKLVLDADAVGSLRPYFQITSPGGVTSTHEKRAPRKLERANRAYHWILPLAPKPRPDEAWFFMVNTLPAPIEGCRLAFRDEAGAEEAVEVPRLDLDQGACIPLHEHFAAVREGTARGSVRLTPSVHVAGWIIRRDVEADLWRVQHL